jgi:phage baseplate assembly protein gpV
MRRIVIIFGAILLLQLFAIIGYSQSDKLSGRWEGKLMSPQGELPANATFKKEGDKYTGTITGQRGDLQLKDIKVEGDKVTAKAEIETGQGALQINYTFTLQGDALKGNGSLDFNGTPFSFDIDLKRAGTAAAAAPAQDAGQAQPQRQRVSVPQPQQKQTIDYFVGQWSFKYVGRESALGAAPREGVATFTKRADGKTLDVVTEGKQDGGAFKETAVITFDEATKQLTYSEKLANGVHLSSRADWSSPISIRFAVEPVKVKNQSLQLKRTISVVAAHSFTVTEELSEDGGPFVRLGTAIYSKVGAQ